MWRRQGEVNEVKVGGLQLRDAKKIKEARLAEKTIMNEESGNGSRRVNDSERGSANAMNWQ